MQSESQPVYNAHIHLLESSEKQPAYLHLAIPDYTLKTIIDLSILPLSLNHQKVLKYPKPRKMDSDTKFAVHAACREGKRECLDAHPKDIP